MTEFDVTIYHNPKCSKSRKALELIQNSGIEPKVVDYLKTPLDRQALEALIAISTTPLRDMLRKTAPEYIAHNLGDAMTDDASILDAILQDPVLLERPVVSTPKGTKLCRPPETVLDLLP